MPHLISLYEKHRAAGLQVLMVSPEPAILLEEFAKEFKIPFRVLTDPKQEAHLDYGVTATPFTLIIDRDGKIAAAHIGYSPSKFYDEVVPAVEQVVKG